MLDIDPEDTFEELMSYHDLEGMELVDAVNLIGMLVNLSYDLGKREGFQRATELGNDLLIQQMPSDLTSILHYFVANAWSGIRAIAQGVGQAEWGWDCPELEHEIVQYRLSLASEGFEALEPYRRCQALTNYGNSLFHAGRFVEAISLWDRALAIEPSFGMALGARGECLAYYARVIFDEGHRLLFLNRAKEDLRRAIDLPLEGTAPDAFARRLQKIETAFPGDALGDLVAIDEFELGQTDNERDYRQWCLSQRLFICPLNDLGTESIAARDVLCLPSIVTPMGEGPGCIGLFNQMKQEFASARFLCYQGLTGQETHFADREVLLLNTLDYPVYSLHIELVKAAYRIAYSLFDKIGFFLNHYYRVGLDERKVSFRSIWYEGKKALKRVRSQFTRIQNYPLRGLFWVAKDLFESKREYHDAIEPDAQRLAMIRQHLEHKYLKVHEDLWLQAGEGADETAGLKDKLACSIGKEDFTEKTVRILQLARSALMYLAFAVHAEEHSRKSDTNRQISAPVFLDPIDDEWKH